MQLTELKKLQGPLLQNYAIPADTTVFVIGDVHGHAAALDTMLRTINDQDTNNNRRIVVFLGDLIDRGPHSDLCLDLAFNRAAELARADEVVILPGNHELMLADAIFAAKLAKGTNISGDVVLYYRNGGDAMINAAYASAGVKEPDNVNEALIGMLDLLPVDNIVTRIRALPSHYRIGDLLCVHAGIAPNMSQRDCLSAAQFDHRHRAHHDVHWAWIRSKFLHWQGGWHLDGHSHYREPDATGSLVVHGHSIAPGASATYDDATALWNTFAYDADYARVCLDAGAARGLGIVCGAFERDGMQLIHVPV